MIAACESLSKRYPAVAGSVPRARAAVAKFAAHAGLTGARLEDLRLAVSEAVTNVVRDAYRGSPGEVRVDVAVASDELWLLIADTGCGYQTPAKNPGPGFGLALIADAADEFVITERATGGTEARIGFRLPRPSPASG
jgi:anti-sigma regulatory factor (Ser/Thr protein kinase)